MSWRCYYCIHTPNTGHWGCQVKHLYTTPHRPKPTRQKGNTMEKTMHTAVMATADQAHTTPDTAAAFADLLRTYEAAHASGADTTNALYALATACALSVVKKCIDPQRKTAAERETVSNGGQNAALVAVRRGIMADLALLDSLTAAHNAAYELRYNKAGELVQEVADKAAEKVATALQGETLSDGLDLVNAAVVAILEQTEAHATAAVGWMETAYTMRRLSRRVVIKANDSAKWEDVETSPIREVYRAVRREVQNSRAMQTDPRNGYLYIEDTAADPDSDKTETIYRRLHKWADLGGYTHTGDYTADTQTAADYESVVSALNLTDRQAQIIRLRMSGYGYKAIATYLGVKEAGIKVQMRRLREKCESIGFSPAMWAEMNAEN